MMLLIIAPARHFQRNLNSARERAKLKFFAEKFP
jgi:hypothetical protein